MNYTFNNYRVRQFGDKYFLSTDSGSHIVLDSEEFMRLKADDIKGELQQKLLSKHIILDENNWEEYVSDLRKRYEFLKKGPGLHIIVPTLRCNMKCIYCQSNSKKEDEYGFDMSCETARKTVDFIFSSPKKSIHIEFQGGEPLLAWEIIKYIVEYAKQQNIRYGKNLKFSMVTNLLAMDNEKADYIVDQGINLCTSMDGPEFLHSRQRPHPRSHEAISYWTEFFNSLHEQGLYHTRLNALLTVTRYCLAYPREIVDEYVNMGFRRIHLRHVHDLGQASRCWQNIGYSAEEFMQFWADVMDYIHELQNRGIQIKERFLDILKKKINNKNDPNYLDLRSPCGSVIGQLAYNYDGDIYACDEARMVGEDIFVMGNVHKHKLKDILSCDKACAMIDSSINDQLVCDDCAYKPYCGVCPVRNFAEQGSLIGNVNSTIRCKIHKAQFDWLVNKNYINDEQR